MNFVLENALDGGVNDALNLDAHGKSLSFRLLDMTVQVSPRWRPVCPTYPATARRRLIHHKNTHRRHTMRTPLRNRLALLLAAALPLAASAQSFPAKPITFIVPFAAAAPPTRSGAPSARASRSRPARPW